MARLSTMSAGLAVAPSRLLPTITNEAQRNAVRVVHEPWRKWYKLKRWHQLRWAILTRDLFTCQYQGCGRSEYKTALLIAHHKQPHKGNPALFWAESNLQCVCKACHDGPIQARERRER